MNKYSLLSRSPFVIKCVFSLSFIIFHKSLARIFFDGQFSIEASLDDVLQISYIGFEFSNFLKIIFFIFFKT